RGVLAKRATRHEELEHRLEVPAAILELDREPIEKLGMGGALSLAAEVLGRAHETIAENLLPEIVHDHPRDDGVVPRGEPTREPEAVSRRAFGERTHDREDVRLERIAVGKIVLPAP